MKKLALIVLTFAIVFGISSGVLVLSDTSNPGQPMYAVDRYMESLSLNVSKMMGNRAYGNLNLRLANERLSEVKFVTGKNNVTSFVFKTYAQDANGTDNEVVKQLIKDFNQNIKEVISAFNSETGDQKDIVLANEIAIKTTEFSNQLVDILADVDAEVETELVETSSILEELDDDAVEALVDDSDGENEDESENRSLSIEKVTKTILKASEKLVETKKDLEEKRNEKKIAETDAVLIASELERVGAQIEMAKVALTNGEVKDAYTNAKLAKEAISSLRDRIDSLEVRDEVSNENESESGVEVENEDESKVEDEKDEDKNDDKKGDKKTTTKDEKKEDDRTKSNSGKEDDKDRTENSGRNEPEEEEKVEVEDEKDSDEDVKGAQDSASSSLWLDLIF